MNASLSAGCHAETWCVSETWTCVWKVCENMPWTHWIRGPLFIWPDCSFRDFSLFMRPLCLKLNHLDQKRTVVLKKKFEIQCTWAPKKEFEVRCTWAQKWTVHTGSNKRNLWSNTRGLTQIHLKDGARGLKQNNLRYGARGLKKRHLRCGARGADNIKRHVATSTACYRVTLPRRHVATLLPRHPVALIKYGQVQ